jgi:hypothetical protein
MTDAQILLNFTFYMVKLLGGLALIATIVTLLLHQLAGE